MPSVSEMGEHEVIETIIDVLEKMPNMPIPFGDDVSAIEIDEEKLIVIKTDMLVGKTDIPPHMNHWMAARKAIVMNMSDLAAKGVKPEGILVSLGIPSEMTKKEILQIGKGLNDGAREYGTYILGGDTNEASDLIISCSVFGVCRKRELVLRSGAKPGDLVAVTGSFGNTTAGLKILLEDLPFNENQRKKLVDSVLIPCARLKEGLTLAQTKAVTSSIDSSDGLAWSLHELSESSNVGFLIDSIPLSEEVEDFSRAYNLDERELALYGGEEYELVLTVRPDLWKKVEEAMIPLKTSLLRIGTVTKKDGVLIQSRGRLIPIERRGWEHFITKPSI